MESITLGIGCWVVALLVLLEWLYKSFVTDAVLEIADQSLVIFGVFFFVGLILILYNFLRAHVLLLQGEILQEETLPTTV